MADDTNTAEREAFRKWAEQERAAGCVGDMEKGWLARASLAASAGSEPAAIYHGRCVIDCGEHGHLDMELLKMIPAGTKLYTHPSPPEGMAGWKLVPVEPTKKMIEAGRWMEYGESSCHMGSVPDGDVIGVWSGMIAAAPPLPASAKEL